MESLRNPFYSIWISFTPNAVAHDGLLWLVVHVIESRPGYVSDDGGPELYGNPYFRPGFERITLPLMREVIRDQLFHHNPNTSG